MWCDCPSCILHSKHKTKESVGSVGRLLRAMTGEATNTLGIYPSLGPDGVMQPPSASAAFVPLSSKSFAKIPGKTLQMQSRGIAAGGPAKPWFPLGG